MSASKEESLATKVLQLAALISKEKQKLGDRSAGHDGVFDSLLEWCCREQGPVGSNGRSEMQHKIVTSAFFKILKQKAVGQHPPVFSEVCLRTDACL